MVPLLDEGMIEGLSEVVLRVNDLDLVQAFYCDVLGLKVWRRFGDDMAFFKLADTAGRRPQTLALFASHWPPNMPGLEWQGHNPSTSTMHHFALSLALPDLLRARQLLASAGIPFADRTFPWAGWRSSMVRDPEGNVVELVALDPSAFVQRVDQ